MLVDENNVCIQLLKALGCDLTCIETITKWKEIVVLGFEFVFACLMITIFVKFLYEMMIRAFKGFK
ncbi:MAG: hypothetical protein Q4E74_09195 [Ruminococcus sp.]|nr:hypothetical protein [Ruminococcus sp.]